MTLDKNKDTLLMIVMEALSQTGENGMKTLLETLFNAVMLAERENALQAKPYERSEERQGYANGYKDRTLQTRVGTLNLRVPKARGIVFYPGSLEQGARSELALKVAVAQMYIQGVSTRKVQSITEELCGLHISSTQVSRIAKELDEDFEKLRNRPLEGNYAYVLCDAFYLKVRHNGIVIDQAVLLAYGINQEGKREFLGASMKLSEAEPHWRDFFKSLQARGLSGVKLIVSDNHAGLRAAMKTVFPSVPWQRCQFHMSHNAQSYVPKQSMKGEIGRAMREIFQSPTLEMAKESINRVKARYLQSAPEFVNWLEENIEEGLTCYMFPEKHRKKIRTSNGLERVNREIRRRVRVAVMFPNAESALRLVTGVLSEIHDDWITGKAYLDMTELKE